VKTHSLSENDNAAMDYVITLLTTIAQEYGVAIDGPHHTRKGGAVAGDADSGRGATAMKDGARLVYTLMRMTPQEAEMFGIKNDAERKLVVRFDSAKVNICPPAEDARWFKLVGVDIGNGTDRYPHGDNVQTAEQWTPPDLWKGVSCELLNRILDDINAGLADGRRYSNHHKAADNGAWTVVQRHIEGRTKEQGRESTLSLASPDSAVPR
jgi:hypothetical protein